MVWKHLWCKKNESLIDFDIGFVIYFAISFYIEFDKYKPSTKFPKIFNSKSKTLKTLTVKTSFYCFEYKERNHLDN